MEELLQSSTFNPKLLINQLKTINNLKNAYNYRIRQYKLEDHTLLVMNVFEKYFSNTFITRNKIIFRLMLALHDIGKPKAHSIGDESAQYKYTVSILNKIKAHLPLNEQEFNLCINLIDNDALGSYLKDQSSLEETKEQILLSAEKAIMHVNDFFKLLTVYYQCDVSSYTKDEGGFAYLEKIFEYREGKKIFDNNRDRLKFSSTYEGKYSALQKELRQ